MAKKKIVVKIKKPVGKAPADLPAVKAKGKKKKQQKAPTPAVVAEVEKVVQANKGKSKANTTPSAVPVRAVQKPGSAIDWSAIRTAYITDPKATIRSLAAKFKVSNSAVSDHCKKEEWAKKRQEWVKKHDSNVLDAAGEDREEVINTLTKKHADLLGKLSDRLGKAVDSLSSDEWEPKNLEALAKATKLVIEGERLTVGLPSDVKGLSDPRGDKLNVTIESLHEKAKEVLNGKDNS
jgi:hypothetical protein